MGAQEWAPCGRGVCAAEEGHAGTCAEASGWDVDPAIESARLTAARLVDQVKRRDMAPLLWTGDQS